MITSGWNRLFIALSVAWPLLVGLMILGAYPTVTPNFAASLTPNPFFSVVATGNRDSPFHISAHLLAIASYVVVPLFLFWAFVAVVRWIKRGFRQGVA